MCLPAVPLMMAASMAISAASAAVSYQENKKSAAAQEKAIMDGYNLEQQQAQRQYADQQAQAQEELGQRYQEGLIEEGRLQAINSESGLQGVSNDRLVDEANNAADRDLSLIEANNVRTKENIRAQIGAKQNQSTVQLSGIRKPSSLGTGLQIAGSAMSIYSASKAPVKT